jgi:hypothetical protein
MEMTSTGSPGFHSRSVATRMPRELTFSVSALSASDESMREISTATDLVVRFSNRPVGGILDISCRTSHRDTMHHYAQISGHVGSDRSLSGCSPSATVLRYLAS